MLRPRAHSCAFLESAATTVTFHDDDAWALRVLSCILDDRVRDLLGSVNVEGSQELAILCDKYDVTNSVISPVNRWLKAQTRTADPELEGRHWPALVTAACTFNLPVHLRALSKAMVLNVKVDDRKRQVLFDAPLEHLLLPSTVLESILWTRQAALQALLDAVQTLSSRGGCHLARNGLVRRLQTRGAMPLHLLREETPHERGGGCSIAESADGARLRRAFAVEDAGTVAR